MMEQGHVTGVWILECSWVVGRGAWGLDSSHGNQLGNIVWCCTEPHPHPGGFPLQLLLNLRWGSVMVNFDGQLDWVEKYLGRL
jgi:hypothetical protein